MAILKHETLLDYNAPLPRIDAKLRNHHYAVMSPEMSAVIPITDEGFGPTEYFCCVAEVEAPTRNAARWLAIKTKEFEPWMDDVGRGEMPIKGLEVVDQKCEHGVCHCTDCTEKRVEEKGDDFLYCKACQLDDEDEV